MLVTETFHGYIETTQDVLLIFEGCRRGLLPRICRRLQERERKMIRSGSIFVFDERESGIKRWTDGRVWSPSRILGNFLIYRELDKKSNDKNDYYEPSTINIEDKNKERQLIGSLSDSYKFRQNGLIKKTMSIIVNGVTQHLISYYDPNEVLQEKLRSPSSVPELASLEISPELLVKQNFRIPPLVEPTFDTNNKIRSMSVGSINNNNIPIYDNNIPKYNHHTRHYSTSSINRFDPRNYTADISSSNSYRQRISNNYQIQQDQERLTSPNLGRLLNPVPQQPYYQQENDYLYYQRPPQHPHQQHSHPQHSYIYSQPSQQPTNQPYPANLGQE